MAKSEVPKTLEDVILEEAAKKSSQFQSVYYNNLVSDGRLETFLKLLSTASAQGIHSLVQAAKFISDNMPGYFKGEDGKLTGKTLGKMIDRYPDVNKAWTVHRNTIVGLAMSRLMTVLETTDNPDLLMRIIDKFDSSGEFVSKKNSADYIPTKRMVNINIDKNEKGNADNGESNQSEEEVATLNQIDRSLELLKTEDMADEELEDGGDEYANIK